MTTRLFVGVFLCLGCFSAKGQAVLLPEPINTRFDEISPAMLPDSSIMLMSNREGKWKCYRFAYSDTSWKASENSLVRMVNALFVGDVIYPEFRFSPDFKRVIVNPGSGKRGIFESEFVQGEWTLFNEILTGYPKTDKFGLSLTEDHKRLYGTTDQVLYEFERQAADFGPPRKVDAFNRVGEKIFEALALPDDGILIRVMRQRKEGPEYYYSKRQANGKWTAAHQLPGLFGDGHALTANRTSFIFVGYPNAPTSDIGIIPVPPVLKAELARSMKRVVAVTPPLQSSQPVEERTGGKNYALLIGNSDYGVDQLDLDKPARDVEVFSRVLTKSYQFEPGGIIKLINANRTQTLQALYGLRTKVRPGDNLLIFYAGHGFWDDQVKQGYWWPVDATPDNPANWLSNSDLLEQIRGINTRHTLLISDACFSGAIFKQRGAEELRNADPDVMLLYRMPSRRAITSGTMSTVPDESVFFKYLIKYLEENQEPFLSSRELFLKLRKAVLNNSLVVPQDGVIMNTGDEGGDFIFMRRK